MNLTHHTRGKSVAREKSVAFIVARLSSSRLPAKHFLKIGPMPLIDWILEELRRCTELDQIVLATVAEQENIPLKEWAEKRGIPCYWYEGDVNHVTTRLRQAAEDSGADICVLVSGDCPLIYAPAIDSLIRQLRHHPEADVISATNDHCHKRLQIQGIGVARTRAWQLADDLSTLPELKEHHFPVIDQRPDLFRRQECELPHDTYASIEHRLSVDTWADMEFMNALYQATGEAGRKFSLPGALRTMEERPDIMDINAHVHQMAVGEKRRKVLMIVDAGNGYGYGHLMRSRELALQITERLGWPVTFIVGDKRAKELLAEVGIRSRAMHEHDSAYLQRFDLIIIDRFSRHLPEPGWREWYPQDSRVVVLDSLQEWTQEADLIVIPGVTYDENRRFDTGKGPEVLEGIDYVILRREIRRLQKEAVPKTIDMLAYLHLPEQQAAVAQLRDQRDYSLHIIQGYEPAFPELLASSRIFLSGFGYSFYEALALGAFPVTWPLSDIHRTDAKKFYRRLGLPLCIVDDSHDIDEVIRSKTYDKKLGLNIEDGTPRIIHSMVSLFLPARGQLLN